MSTRIESRLQGLARLAALAAGLIALLTLAGWVFEMPRLRSFAAGAIGMPPNAAVAALLLAASLPLLAGEKIAGWRRRLAQAGAGLVAALTVVTLLEYILGWEAGIDGEFGQYSGRMAALAAFDYLLLGAAVTLAAGNREWSRRLGQGAALLAGLVSLLSLLGYTFQVASLYTLSKNAEQSLPSALACFLLSLGALLAWPERGWMRVLSSEHAGGRLLRLALPLMVSLTWLISWLSVAGARAGFYSEKVDQVLVALPLTLVFGLFFFVMAARLNRAGEEQQAQRREVERLNRELEARVERRTAELGQTISALEQEMEERKRAEGQLRQASSYTRTLIEASLDPLVTIRKDGKVMDVNRATEEVTGVARERLIGSDFSDYFTEPDKARAGYEQVFATGRVQDYPLAIRHISGRVTEVLYNATVYKNEAGEVEGVFAAARDVSERKRGEEAQARLAAIVESSNDAIVAKSLQGVILNWNEGAARMYGYLADEVLGQSIQLLVPKEEREELTNILKRVAQGERVDHFDTERVCKDGRHIRISLTVSPIRDASGRIVGASSIARDITQRKRAEEEARRASLYSRNLIEASLDPLVTISRDGKIMDVNRATEEATGVPRRRLVGSDFCNYFTEPERARQGYEQVFSQGSVQDYPLVMRQPSGQVMEVLYNATVFRNERGEVEGVFAAARNVTARRRAEREAQRLNRALRALIECNEAVVRASDESSLLKQVCDIAVGVGGYRMAWVGYAEQDENKTVRPMAQAGAEEGYLGSVNITWADAERGRGPTGTAIRTGAPAICQDTLTDPDFAPWREEAQRHGFRSSIVLPLAGEPEVFGSLSIYAAEVQAFDAAEQRLLEELADDLSYGILALRAREQVRVLNRELEDRVRQRTAALEESNRELESFTYSVSHDLRAPLRHVDGFSKILLEEYGPQLDEAGRGYLERMRQGTQFMGRLVDDLLNLSRVGRQALSVQITGLGTLVEEVRKELAAEEQSREVEWKIGELPFVECDPGLMKQVLANLLSNALKFTRPRSRAVIEVGQRPGEDGPVIFVRDNGVGFHMKYADKLFGIFQRLHRQEDFEGTGVGLATVERILHKHGGKAWAEAELDKGATFYFTLGAAEVTAVKPAERQEAAA